MPKRNPRSIQGKEINADFQLVKVRFDEMTGDVSMSARLGSRQEKGLKKNGKIAFARGDY